MSGGSMPWTVAYGRTAIHRDIQRMIDTDPIMSAAAQVWTDSITSPNGDEQVVKINCEDQSVEAEFEELRKRIGLDDLVRQSTYEMKAYGNVFPENVVNADFDIVRVKFLPEEYMVIRKSPDGRAGWEVQQNGELKEVPPYAEILPGGSGTAAIEFEDWQVYHIADTPVRRDGYGTSLFGALRRDWKALDYAESSLTIARIMRAYSKNVHIIPMPLGVSPADRDERIKAYKASMNRTQVMDWRGDEKVPGEARSALSVDRDVFTIKYFNNDLKSVGGEVQLLDPQNQQLQNINDVEHAQRKILVGLGIPPGILGIEADVSSHALFQGQERAYGRRCRAGQTAQKQWVRWLFDTQRKLKGTWEPDTEYEIEMPEVQMQDNEIRARTELLRARTADILANRNAIDAKAIGKHYTDLSDEQITAIQARMAAEPKPAPVVVKAGSNGAALPAENPETAVRV
jgi:hypothetical protein